MKIKKGISAVIFLFIVIAMSFSLTACGGKPLEEDPPPPPPAVVEYIFNYEYNEATDNNTIKSVEFEKEDDLTKTKLVVPSRDGYEFDGWYSDWLFKSCVSDNQGSLVIGEEIFNIKSKSLFAKWRNDNAPVYPILMVFVTEVDAVLKDNDEKEVIVKYSMTEDERKACEMIPEMLEEYLDALLNGLVNFEIDTFFTTNTIGTRSFIPGIGTSLGGTELLYNYDLVAYNIPELGGMEWPELNGLPPISEIEGDGILSKYKSIITTFNMNDHNDLLHFVGGSSGKKYASIHMETLFSSLMKQGYSVDFLFDFNTQGVLGWWEAYMGLYLHEFTHSVELYLENKAVNPIDYHDAYKYYLLNGLVGKDPTGAYDQISFIRLYLLHKVDVEGNILGIPENFWFVEK